MELRPGERYILHKNVLASATFDATGRPNIQRPTIIIKNMTVCEIISADDDVIQFRRVSRINKNTPSIKPRPLKKELQDQKLFMHTKNKTAFTPFGELSFPVVVPKGVRDKRSAEAEKAKEAPAERGKEGQLTRGQWTNSKIPNDLKSFFKKDQKQAGHVRLHAFQKLKNDNTEHIKLKKIPWTINKNKKPYEKQEASSTFCAYCLDWFETIDLDSDHVATFEEIGKWLDAVALLLNTLLKHNRAALNLKHNPAVPHNALKRIHANLKRRHNVFSAAFKNKTKIEMGDVFFLDKNTRKWTVSKRGVELMFQNVNNLVLACKTCNQALKNNMKGREFTSSIATFGREFDELYPPPPGNKALAWRKLGLGQIVRKYNRDHNKDLILHTKNIYKSNATRTNRIRKAYLLEKNSNGNAGFKQKAEGKYRKEKHITSMLDSINQHVRSKDANDITLNAAQRAYETIAKYGNSANWGLSKLADSLKREIESIEDHIEEAERLMNKILQEKQD